ncbi:energy-coupling factor ABC transporter permease [Vibrio penaeicida]|uniref:energy-coupling factor ABC transporter permease n=1 Tax=Vibrio penaeicida TaxID=104609 RepID=UPI00273725B9|nr:energy-coupling factor ABC transporter permease [Vibrio penaeicida]MDP2571283.1 energy-coupling factor ABC transporter permease [Vibrio penaeicida]
MSILQFLCLAVTAFVVQRCWADTKHVFFPKFLSERSFQNLTIITLAILFFLWQTKAGVKSGLDIHFLGVTAFTMMFGWRVACFLSLPIFCALAIFNQWSLIELPVQITISGFIPIFLSYFIFALSYHYLPKNVFVFIFVAGFFNAMFVGSTHLLLKGSYYLWQGLYDFTTVMDNFFILIPLMAFPEGLLNGMTLAVLCVYRPEWLRVFSDRHYLFPNK